MIDKTAKFIEAMKQAQLDPDTLKLTTEQQFVKVIQALVAQCGGDIVITPSVFSEPDTLTCEQDDRGNITLTAKKSIFAAAK
jgi:hypothetical protein